MARSCYSLIDWKNMVLISLTSIVIILLFGVFPRSNAKNIDYSDDLPKAAKKLETKYVIFDTDMGADDAWSLQMLVNAEKRLKNIKVLAVTTSDGNTNIENVIKNAYRILDGLNRTDIPIYKGASEAIITTINTKDDHFYGRNGLSDIDIWMPHYPNDINSIVQKKNAIEIIRDLVMAYPKGVIIYSIAPLTNIALAIRTYPEIKENIREVYIMGGSFRGRGNIVPAAEFNFYKDPESAYIVLNSLKCPITILPMDADENTHITMEWRLKAFKDIKHPNVLLLNEVERIAFRNAVFYLPFDVFATSAFLFPDKVIQKMSPYKATMELGGHYTRGTMIINHHSTDYNVNIIEKISEDEFKKALIWAANYD